MALRTTDDCYSYVLKTKLLLTSRHQQRLYYHFSLSTMLLTYLLWPTIILTRTHSVHMLLRACTCGFQYLVRTMLRLRMLLLKNQNRFNLVHFNNCPRLTLINGVMYALAYKWIHKLRRKLKFYELLFENNHAKFEHSILI